MTKITTWLFAALFVAIPVAQAEGWYAGAYFGMADTDDSDFGTALGTVTTTFDGGGSYGLFLGYDTSRLRIEGELSMRDDDVEDHILGGSALPGPTGEASSTSVMGNLIYDFNRGGRVEPYLGAGIGFTDVDFEDFGVAPIPNVLNDGDSSLAYQMLVGLGIGLNEDWDLFLDYRWLAADDLSLTVSDVAGAVTSDVDYEVSNFGFGLRYSF